MAEQPRIPDPALVVLVGPSGSGKSTWADAHFRAVEIVSSDSLRGIVGSGPNDLDASVDAFELLDLIVAGRIKRGLTTVIDTLGLESSQRRRYLGLARDARLPAVSVVLQTDPAECRRRNAARDLPVPAAVLAGQLKRLPEAIDGVESEGWDMIIRVRQTPPGGASAEPAPSAPAPSASPAANGPAAMGLVLQISRFPWGADPAAWLTQIAAAAQDAGLGGIALMDHLIQIPQVGRAWEPIPEPFVTLGLLAGRTSRLRLGTLVSPVTFRPPGVLAKTMATLDALSGGRSFCGMGAGWWGREHAAFGVNFPSAGARLDHLEVAIETARALWSPGTRAYHGQLVDLPETTCYLRRSRSLSAAAANGGRCRSPPDLATGAMSPPTWTPWTARSGYSGSIVLGSDGTRTR